MEFYVLEQHMLSRIRFRIRLHNTSVMHCHLNVYREFFHTRVPRRASVEAAIPIRLSNFLSRQNLIVIVDPDS